MFYFLPQHPVLNYCFFFVYILQPVDVTSLFSDVEYAVFTKIRDRAERTASVAVSSDVTRKVQRPFSLWHLFPQWRSDDSGFDDVPCSGFNMSANIIILI